MYIELYLDTITCKSK